MQIVEVQLDKWKVLLWAIEILCFDNEVTLEMTHMHKLLNVILHYRSRRYKSMHKNHHEIREYQSEM